MNEGGLDWRGEKMEGVHCLEELNLLRVALECNWGGSCGEDVLK